MESLNFILISRISVLYIWQTSTVKALCLVFLLKVTHINVKLMFHIYPMQNCQLSNFNCRIVWRIHEQMSTMVQRDCKT